MNIPVIRFHKQVYRTTWLMKMCNFASDASDNRKAPITDWLSDDYQLLHRSVLPTMHFQKSLLRLPIPSLDKTCSRYLRSQKALLNEVEYSETEKTVEDFRVNLGPPLQKQLQEWDKNNKHTSYISKPWFDMYLSDRAPVVLNYNPFLALLPPEPPNTNQLVRATNLLVSSARFLRTLRAGVLEPEVYHLFPAKSDTEFFRKVAGWAPQMFASLVGYALKAFPLDMSQFNNLFNSTRVPRLGCDTLHCDSSAKHVLVMRNGNFYVFDILDENGCVYPPSHLHACLAYIAADITPRPSHPLGYLTTENRDTWAKVREELSSAGNTEALRALDYAAFNLVLDDAIVGQDPEACFRTFLYGDGGNRWFDKSFSVIFTKDAMAALNFEHSWGDGVAVMRYFNEVVRDMQRHTFVTDNTVMSDTDPANCVKILEFNVPESVAAAVDAARHRYEAATSALAVHVFESDVMNKNFCKTHGVSPDAIMQLGFQLTYRLHTGDVTATYESCSTSAFKHGRTETLRPATLETRAFSDAVCRGADLHQLREMALQCSKVHGELTKQAAMGQGFDRHLFGLRKLAEQQSAALPALYQDPAYTKINHNILSTSTLPSNLISFGGFAPVVQDGFGVGYQIQDDRLGIVLSSYPPHRDGQGFVDSASKAYTIIRDALTVK